jgi:hypothetical protein
MMERLQEINKGTRAFSRKEFKNSYSNATGFFEMFKNGSDPGRAFDSSSKILFIEMVRRVARAEHPGKFS